MLGVGDSSRNSSPGMGYGVCVSLADWDQCALTIASLAGMHAKTQAEEKNTHS